MLTVVEFYKPWWSDRDEPRPVAYANRNAALRAAAEWSADLAVDRKGTFKCDHINKDRDMQFIVVYEDQFGDNFNEVALVFDVNVIH